MTRPKSPPPVSRYNWREIAQRVNWERTRRTPPGEKDALDIKGLADRIGMTPAVLRKKLGAVTERGKPARTPFTIEELGRIAALYDAPSLWPFLDWKALEDIWARKKG